eukprot:TRINITY_DN6316_c0_g1_i11.p1 TRINITY_DN6316_c0_g1~~TRINITY_DN6316_c0_g1_i11.p1  ORF type:complete len:296 (-),score=15.47 TRINITY_DN6316_c0_g1_i11:236-1123(-)
MGTYQITLKRKKGRQHQMEPKENASEQLLREGKFYEYELLIKRKFSRLKTKGDKTQTINLLSEGIINLSKNNQVNGVTDLCICLLTFLKEDLPFASTPPIKQIMCEIVSHIPFSKQKIQFVNLLLGEVYPVDNSDLCHAIGLQCIQEDEDGLAQKYFLFDQDNEFVCKFLERWFSKGADGEQAFLVSRFILMKLLTQDIAGCRSIIQYFSQKITSPLINFTREINQLSTFLKYKPKSQCSCWKVLIQGANKRMRSLDPTTTPLSNLIQQLRRSWIKLVPNISIFKRKEKALVQVV